MCTQTRPRLILSSERVHWEGGGGGGMESEPMLPPGEKSSLPEVHRRLEPATLYYAGQ